MCLVPVNDGSHSWRSSPSGNVITLLGCKLASGLRKFRELGTITHRLGDEEWNQSFCRHHKRQGMRSQLHYDIKHDIYSLSSREGFLLAFHGKDQRSIRTAIATVTPNANIKQVLDKEVSKLHKTCTGKRGFTKTRGETFSFHPYRSGPTPSHELKYFRHYR